MTTTEEPAISRNVIEMITVANEYCLFLEGIEKYTKDDIISYFQKICPLLYLKLFIATLLTSTSSDGTSGTLIE